MQRLHNIDKWEFAEPHQAVNFEAADPRKVRIDVNAPGKVAITYVDTKGLEVFLGIVEGRDVLEFTTTGEFALIPDGPLWFYTIDGVKATFSIPDAITLTRIAERRARNLEFEMMQYKMNQNLERRLAEQRDQLVELLGRSEAVVPASAPKPAAASSDSGAGKESAPAEAPDEQSDGAKPAA